MKTRIHTAGLLILAWLLPNASDAFAQRFFSLEAGLNHSRVNGIGSEFYIPKNTWHAGFGFEIIYSNPVGFRTGMYLNHKAFQSEKTTIQDSYREVYYNQADFQSFLIPLLTSWHIGKIALEVGPYLDFSFKHNQHEKWLRTYHSDGHNTVVEKTNRHRFKNPEPGMMASMRMKLPAGIELRLGYRQAFVPLGNDYHWSRLGHSEISLIKSFGRAFEPARSGTPGITEELANRVPYRTYRAQHINRSTLVRTADGNNLHIRFRSAEMGQARLSNIMIESNSGNILSFPAEVRIDDVIFPVTLMITYKATHPVTQHELDCMIELQIFEAGNWDIQLYNH